jgi:hypothetical protein
MATLRGESGQLAHVALGSAFDTVERQAGALERRDEPGSEARCSARAARRVDDDVPRPRVDHRRHHGP